MKLLIIGAGGSGKSTLVERLARRGLTEGVFDTDREVRPGEVDGVHYNFISTIQYAARRDRGEYLVSQTYGHRSYGLKRSEWQRADLFVFTPSYMAQLCDAERRGAFAVYLDIPRPVRAERLEARYPTDPASVVARLIQDDADFSGYGGFDMVVTNPDGVF